MRLSTIQKRNKLNDVYAVDEVGLGGAYHNYAICHDVFPVGAPKETYNIATIAFQCGPRNVDGSVSGVLDTDLLEIVRHRLQCFQAGPFASEENAHALQHIEEALMWFNKRVEDRAERGVLGENKK